MIGAVGLSETDFAARVKIYPNPTNGIFRIQFDEEVTDVEVSIKNLLGEVINELRYDATKEIELMLSDSPGIYFVGVRSSMNEEVIIRVVKE